MGLSAACTTEDIVDSSNSNQSTEEGTYISITPNDLFPVNMNSRAAVDELLYKVNDINIKITAANKTVYVYCTGNQLYLNGSPANSTKTRYINDEHLAKGNNVFVHVNDVASNKVTSIEAIANYGSDLYNNKDWNTIKEEGNAKLENGLCIMYGKTEKPNEKDNQHDGTGSLHCDIYQVDLKRTRAMFTVSLNGTNDMKPGVSITPKSMKVCNIPSSCWVTKDNAIDGKNIKKATDLTYTAAELKWDGSVTQGKSVGVHAKNDDASLPNGFVPIYMYENKQGITENTDKKTKYPQGCTSIDDAKSNQTHSYIEIEADYKYEENGSLKNSGTVIYRFFLGGNDRNDFNMQRNCYYRLTLNLKGFGGAAEDGKVEDGKLVVNDTDASWRVDMNIRDWGFEKDEYDFDAHAVMGEIAVIGSGWTLQSMEGADKYSSWLRFKSDSYGTAGWAEPTDDNIQGKNGKIIFYIQPMQSWEFENYPNEKRTITLTIKKGVLTQTITISQWTPIKINDNIWMERFEEDDCIQSWGFDNEDIANKQITFEGLGTKRKYAVGEDVSITKELGNTYYGYQLVKNAAHAYCYRKGGNGIEGSPAGATAEPYALPDWNTFQLLLGYSRNHPNGNFDPIKEDKDYWTSSVPVEKGEETIYWNGEEQSQSTTTERPMTKRTRAVFIGQIYE